LFEAGGGFKNQVVYHIGILAPITPSEPLPPLPAIPCGSLVIVEGRAPIWRYGMALHLLHGSPASAIAGLLIRA